MDNNSITYGSGTAIASITDKSGNGRTASQITATNQPTQTIITGSNPVALFDGNGDYLDFSEASTIRTAIAVAYREPGSTGAYQHILSHSTIEPDYHGSTTYQYQDAYR